MRYSAEDTSTSNSFKYKADKGVVLKSDQYLVQVWKLCTRKEMGGGQVVDVDHEEASADHQGGSGGCGDFWR